jgi:NitT/TauT family transport system substrate-binding protein
MIRRAKEEYLNINHRSVLAIIGLLATLALPLTASAADRVRVATAGKGAWDASAAWLGQQAGIFAKHGIDVDISYTDGGVKSLEAVIAGSIDVAMGVSVPNLIGAVVKDAPVVMICGIFTGLSDTLWYARADSPIKSVKDFTEDTSFGYSAAGAYNQIAGLALLQQAGVKAKMIAAGSRSATLTLVMSGQLDVGFDGNGGMGVPEFQKNEVRIIARGEDIEAFRGLTVRGFATSKSFLTENRQVLVRFLQAYQETIDWMYKDQKAVEMYAKEFNLPVDEVARLVPVFYPKSAFGIQQVHGIERSIEQGLQFKRISEPPTAEQLTAAFEMIWIPEQK